MTRVAVAGHGYWGEKVARAVAATPGLDVAMVFEPDPAAEQRAREAHPGATVVRGHLDTASCHDHGVDAVAVVTPPGSHYLACESALASELDVLVAKPLTTAAWQAEHLARLAETTGRILMVDHTFVYTAAVREIMALVRSGDLGDLLYYDSARMNLGTFQADVDVVWDLAVHDLAIIHALTGEGPERAHVDGWDVTGTGRLDHAYLTCEYPCGLVAHAHASWLSPVKVRRVVIGGTGQAVVWDDVEPTDKLRVYDRAVKANGVDRLVDYRTGDCWIPKLDLTEALKAELTHFADCVRTREQPLTGPAAGIKVVRALETASTGGFPGPDVRALRTASEALQRHA